VLAGKRFAAALPLEMLDQKGVEVVLIGESDNLVRCCWLLMLLLSPQLLRSSL
jgi:hypothetical protein